MRTEYNGHRSWNAWNVSLWINNDESIYRYAVNVCERSKALGAAARSVLERCGGAGSKTPDGATYNLLSVRLAITDIWEDAHPKPKKHKSVINASNYSTLLTPPIERESFSGLWSRIFRKLDPIRGVYMVAECNRTRDMIDAEMPETRYI